MTTRKKPGWTFWITVAVMLLPVLYVLSVGPYAGLIQRGLIPESVWVPLRVTWVPLNWCQEWEPFEEAIVWYIGLWMP